MIDAEFWALKNINFSVSRNETIGIIGKNGSGKSTLLKILSKIVMPTSGSIQIRGRVSSLLEIGTGFHPELSGRENIYLSGAILGMKKSEIDSAVEEIINFADLGRFINTPIKRYSSGMYVRLAFAVAAHLIGEILFIDEVLAVGDMEFQQKCVNKIKSLTNNHDRTVILVSHNMDIIKSLCNRCVLLKDGVIKADGASESVVNIYLNINNDEDVSAKRRKGNGKIVITKLGVYKKNGERADILRSGEDAVFVVEYKVNDKSVKHFDLALPVKESSGKNIIAQVYTKYINQKIIVNNDIGVAKIIIKKLPLNQGLYNYSAWLDCDDEVLDWLEDAGSFKVLPGNFYETGKVPPTSQGQLLMEYEVVKRI